MAQNHRFVCLVAVTTPLEPTAREGGAPVEATPLYRFFRAGDAQTLALQGVSISVSAGELVVVSGPSGSGKCLAGIDNPDGGIVAEPSCWMNCVHRWPVCTTPADRAATSTATRSALCTTSWGRRGHMSAITEASCVVCKAEIRISGLQYGRPARPVLAPLSLVAPPPLS